MGGGWSTKQSIVVNDAESKVNLKANAQESKDDMNDVPSNKLNSKLKSRLS